MKAKEKEREEEFQHNYLDPYAPMSRGPIQGAIEVYVQQSLNLPSICLFIASIFAYVNMLVCSSLYFYLMSLEHMVALSICTLVCCICRYEIR
jgi:hypothetical protein